MIEKQIVEYEIGKHLGGKCLEIDAELFIENGKANGGKHKVGQVWFYLFNECHFEGLNDMCKYSQSVSLEIGKTLKTITSVFYDSDIEPLILVIDRLELNGNVSMADCYNFLRQFLDITSYMSTEGVYFVFDPKQLSEKGGTELYQETVGFYFEQDYSFMVDQFSGKTLLGKSINHVASSLLF